MAEKKGTKRLAENRKARHEYFIEDTYECGLALAGTEVKSIRAGKVNLKDSYAQIKKGEAYIIGMHISPYEVTDAGGAFPSGDAFSVYPYENGVIPSLRQKVFKEAIDDIGFLTLAESKLSKDKVVAIMEDAAEMEITFKQYPKDEEFFSEMYRRLLDAMEI